MYVKRIQCQNIGPIKKAVIESKLDDLGNPLPIVIVGENGSGKSTLISNIADSFFETAQRAFDNALKTNETKQGYQYFKAVSSEEIHIGEKSMFAVVELKDGEQEFQYWYKHGELSFEDFKEKAFINTVSERGWEERGSHKSIDIEKPQAEEICQKNVLCYFGPDRYEKPHWMGEKYYHDEVHISPFIRRRFSGEIINPIQVKNMSDETLKWLLDVIVDSRPNVMLTNTGWKFNHTNEQDIHLLGIARTNIEKVLSEILRMPVALGLNYRSSGGARFNIRNAGTNECIVPTLDSLSTGQSALFNMFATIVRYADQLDINKSIHLEDITGVVIIDEVELHLHTSLQREVVPKLFKLFPKVQFIISTHSPLLLLGMGAEYGEKLEIIQMPEVEKIEVEDFSEFQKAYEYISKTRKFRNDFNHLIPENLSKPLVITEGL